MVGTDPGAGDTASAGAASFPSPGTWRFLLDHLRAAVPGAAELERRAEPVHGSAPEGGTRINIIGSRSHIGRRTRLFMKTLGAEFDEVTFVHIGSSLKLCMVAEGSAHIYPRFWPTIEWDTAAAHALVRAARGELLTAPAGSYRNRAWLTEPTARGVAPMRYNRRNLTNGPFVARGW